MINLIKIIITSIITALLYIFRKSLGSEKVYTLFNYSSKNDLSAAFNEIKARLKDKIDENFLLNQENHLLMQQLSTYKNNFISIQNHQYSWSIIFMISVILFIFFYLRLRNVTLNYQNYNQTVRNSIIPRYMTLINQFGHTIESLNLLTIEHQKFLITIENVRRETLTTMKDTYEKQLLKFKNIERSYKESIDDHINKLMIKSSVVKANNQEKVLLWVDKWFKNYTDNYFKPQIIQTKDFLIDVLEISWDRVRTINEEIIKSRYGELLNHIKLLEWNKKDITIIFITGFLLATINYLPEHCIPLLNELQNLPLYQLNDIPNFPCSLLEELGINPNKLEYNLDPLIEHYQQIEQEKDVLSIERD